MAAALLVCSVVIILCIAANRFSFRFGLPSLLLFMALGMLFGSDGIFKIPFDNYNFADQVCSIALIFIMFYGGFGTKWDMARPVAVKAVSLSTLGVVMTALITGVFCHFVLGFGFLESFLIGSVISSTDAASVFSILRSKKLGLKEGTASLLELESGSNDPAAYMLTTIVLSLMSGDNSHSVGYLIFAQVVYGLLIGVAVAFLAVLALRKLKFTDGLDTIFVLAVALLSFALPAVIGGNGYLGAYLAGIIIGNSKIKHKISLVHFFDGITGLAQIMIFFLLGLLAFPHQIGAIIVPSLLIAVFLTVFARPVTVFTLLAPMRCSLGQMLLVSWSGLRGASSIVFAIVVTASGVDTNNDVFHIVFCIALLSVAIQGTLLPVISRKLNMVDEENDIGKTFNDYQDEKAMHLIRLLIQEGHRWAGQTIHELDLSSDMMAVMIRRNEETIIPKGGTVIQAGDILVLNGEVYKDETGMVLKEIAVDGDHDWAGKKIKELELNNNTLIMLVRRNDGSTVVPNGDTKILKGDVIVVNEESD